MEQSLYEVARKLDLGSYLKLGRGEEAGGGRERTSILAEPGSRVCGCLSGRRYYSGFCPDSSVPAGCGEEEAVEERRRDYKTALQELVQRQADQVLVYQVVGEQGRIMPRRLRQRCCSTVRRLAPAADTAKKKPNRLRRKRIGSVGT